MTQRGGLPFLSFREKLVSVKKNYLYPDYQAGDADVFSREPFVVWFQSPHTGETHDLPSDSVNGAAALSGSCHPRVYAASLGRL